MTSFTENSALRDGGAVLLENETVVTLEDCHFEGNDADDEGGALYIDDSELTVERATFDDNDPNDTWVDDAGFSETWGEDTVSFYCEQNEGCEETEVEEEDEEDDDEDTGAAEDSGS